MVGGGGGGGAELQISKLEGENSAPSFLAAL